VCTILANHRLDEHIERNRVDGLFGGKMDDDVGSSRKDDKKPLAFPPAVSFSLHQTTNTNKESPVEHSTLPPSVVRKRTVDGLLTLR